MSDEHERAEEATRVRSPRILLAALLLAVGAFALYSPAFGHAFVSYDDGPYVTENPHVRAGLTRESVVWAFTEFHSANWHPLTWLSHMLDVELFGLDAGAHHRTGALLHALAAGLCLLALVALTGRFWASLLVAALFAAHPLRVESVAWVAERKDVLAGVFFFATLLAYAAYARRPSRKRYLGVLALVALGLLAKPMLVTLPCVLLLLDLWPLRRTERPLALLKEKLPLLAMVAAACVVTVFAQREGGAVRTFEAIPLGARVANSVEAYALYLGKAFLPTDLAFFYPHRIVASESGFHLRAFTFVAGGWLLAVTAAAVLLRGSRALLVGWLWYLGMLVPVIGLVQVGAQEMADRYAYLPLVGVTIALVFGLEELVSDRRAEDGAPRRGVRGRHGLRADHAPPDPGLEGQRHPVRARARGHRAELPRTHETSATSSRRAGTGPGPASTTRRPSPSARGRSTRSRTSAGSTTTRASSRRRSDASSRRSPSRRTTATRASASSWSGPRCTRGTGDRTPPSKRSRRRAPSRRRSRSS